MFSTQVIYLATSTQFVESLLWYLMGPGSNLIAVINFKEMIQFLKKYKKEKKDSNFRKKSRLVKDKVINKTV